MNKKGEIDVKTERNLDMLIDKKKYTRIEEKMESLVARERKGGKGRLQ